MTASIEKDGVLALGLIFVGAIAASLAVTPYIARRAGTVRLFDAPTDRRRIHREPLPRLGGVAVFAAVATVLLVAITLGVAPSISSSGMWLGVLAGSTVLFVAGLWDDLRGLPPAAKLAAQTVAASIAYAAGFRIESLSLGSGGEVALGWFGLAITVLWIVGVTNAFNLIDGLDGLASGIAVIALATVISVASAFGNSEAVVAAVALAGALLGFLKFNFSPARIFLGDSGSLFIGFLLAVLCVEGARTETSAVLMLLPLFALAVPLLDTGLTIVRRWLRGVPLSRADAQHIHHRLLAAGLCQRRATGVLYVVAILLAAEGMALAFSPPGAGRVLTWLGGGVMLAGLGFGLRRLNYHEFSEARAVLASSVPSARRAIRDQIRARDVARLLGHAENLKQLEAILGDHAAQFGFLAVEFCHDAPCSRPSRGDPGHRARHTWKVDFPVAPRSRREDDAFVLRIWCEADVSPGPGTAERVGRVLATEVEQWLSEHDRILLSDVAVRVPALVEGARELRVAGR